MSDQVRRLGALLVVSLLAIAPASPALGAATPSARTTAQVSEPDHCVVTARRVGAPSRGLEAPRCFATFAEAVAEATFGEVELEPDAHRLRRADLQTPANGERIATVLGIEYGEKNFRGWSYIIQGVDSAGCRSGGKYRVPVLPAERNNAISSALSYGGCKSRHFNGPNLTGASHLCGCGLMGTMDNQTSSIRFTATGSRLP